MKVFLEYRDGKSQKFWEIQTEGASHTVRFGRIGSNGQTKTKTFSSASEAEAAAHKLVESKRKKGYVDAGGGGDAAAVDVVEAYAERIEDAVRGVKDSIYRSEDEARLAQAVAYIKGERDKPPELVDDYGFDKLVRAFAPVSRWTEVDGRVLDVLMTLWTYDKKFSFGKRKGETYEKGFFEAFYGWLAKQVAEETDGFDTFGVAIEHVRARGIGERQILRHVIEEMAGSFENDQNKPSSSGRYVLANYPAQAKAMLEVGKDKRYGTLLCRLLARHARADFDEQLPKWWKAEGEWGAMQLAKALLQVDAKHYLDDAVACLGRLKECWPRFVVARELCGIDKKRFGAQARETAEAQLAQIKAERAKEESYSDSAWDSSTRSFISKTPTVIEFLLKSHGKAVKALIHDYVESTHALDLGILELCVRYLGQDALETVAEGFGVPIEGKDSAKFLGRFLKILAQLDWSEHHDDVWQLCKHKSKPIRETAAAGMARLGDAALPKAIELLADKKADHRHGGALVLAIVASTKAVGALQELVDSEKSDDVRDFALGALDEIYRRQGKKIDKATIDKHFARARASKKLDKPLRPWLDEKKLPALSFKGGGGKLDAAWVRYLLYRQARCSGVAPDVELRPLLERIDRKSSGDFALALLEKFIAKKASAKDKFCMALACLLGDDRVVEPLVENLTKWAGSGRGALAEDAVRALPNIGSDKALRAVADCGRRFRVKPKNVGEAAGEAFAEAADRIGVSVDELHDRVVPDLGFEGGGYRVEIKGTALTVRIAPDFKLRYQSAEGKLTKSAPKGASAALKSELKELAKEVREVGKAQAARLEGDMVLQRRWSAKRFRELFVGKAILVPFGARLVWGLYDARGKCTATFRALDDGSFTDVADDAVKLPAGGSVGIVHPLELPAKTRDKWAEHFASYGVVPAFSQLDRRVVRCPKDDVKRTMHYGVEDKEVNAGTLVGRANRMGWRRGSVCDGGSVTSYHKVFPSAGVDVILETEGVGVVVDHYSSATLKRAYFVAPGAVQFGSYVYDEPRHDDDKRLIRFGKVPPIAYSEAMAQIERIAGD